jgi:hypothetical protein
MSPLLRHPVEIVLSDVSRRRITDALTRTLIGRAAGGGEAPGAVMRDLFRIRYRYRYRLLLHIFALDHAGWYLAGLRSEFPSDTVGAELPEFPRTCTRWSRAAIVL